MEKPPQTRSVKIDQDERGGWSSDRPRRGGPERPPNISVRCRVLSPSDELRYSPSSLLVVASAHGPTRDAFTDRLIDRPGALLSLDRVRKLLTGRVAEDVMEERAQELLDAAARKRFEAGEPVVISTPALDPAERERLARAAASARRPRHLILLEVGRDQVAEEDRPALNELRRRLDAGELGAEGFQTVLRLNAEAASELKRIVFAPEPRDD